MSLRDAAIERDAINARITLEVVSARDAGASWTEIAMPLGISKQAAQQKYGKIIQAPAARELPGQTAMDDVQEAPAIVEPAPARVVDPLDHINPSATMRAFVEKARELGLDVQIDIRETDAEDEYTMDRITAVVNDRNPGAGWLQLTQTGRTYTGKSWNQFEWAPVQTSKPKKISRAGAMQVLTEF